MNDILDRIEDALNDIRPYLIADGGNVKIQNLDSELNLMLEFEGSCVSCPMSSMTFKAGIEEAVMKKVPEIKNIIASNIN